MKLAIIILFIMVSVKGGSGSQRNCSNPKGNDGQSHTEGCLRKTCKDGIWRPSLEKSVCCYQREAYPPNTTITTDRNGCSTASIECRADGNKAKMVLHVENKCGKYSTEVNELKEMLLKHMDKTDQLDCSCPGDTAVPLSTPTVGQTTATKEGVSEFSPHHFLQGCDKRFCYPATGNLLIGREDKLSSSNTCGLNKKDRYCIISSLDSHTYGGPNSAREKCYNCDTSDPELAHNVESIVHRWEPPGFPRANQRMTWWQATNGNEKVTLQLDLEAEFHVTHIIITFKTFRPAAMYIETSFDWGKTWKIYRYFAHDCEKDFPDVHIGVPRYLNETVCQSKYSKLAPSTKGEVIYQVLPPNIKSNSPGFNPYNSKGVQDLLKTTNLRVTFTKLHTLGDEKLGDVNSIDMREKYYYSIYDMIVHGSCSCYGHAARCVPEKEEHKDIPGMVHGTCECDHNTKGTNCEDCMDFYRDLPWRPATGKKKNQCKKCNCNEHSEKCYFDSRVFAASAETSGGVCLECQHNTEGKNCEMCKFGFYQDPAKQITDTDICAPCDCEPDGTDDGGLCDERTSEEAETVAGQCHCKTYVGGPRCDHCSPGYWNFTVENPDGCQQCNCNPLGGGCNEQTGECQSQTTATKEGILITGGWGAETSTEVFIPDTGKSCSLASLPDRRNGHTMDALTTRRMGLSTNLPVICGGGADNTQYSCLQFYPISASGVWTNFAETRERRDGHTSWVSSAGLVLIGGAQSLTTTDLVTSGQPTLGNFSLIQDTRYACAITDKDSTILTGGRDTMKVVASYNLQGLVETLPEMNQGRRYHGCGSYSNDGTTVLIVAGGRGEGYSNILSSTEKMTIGATAWITVRPLPRAMIGVAMVSMDNKIFLTGGGRGGRDDHYTRRSEILAFDREDWKKVGQLQNARNFHAATKIDITDLSGFCN